MSHKSVIALAVIFGLILTGYILVFLGKTKPEAPDTGVKGFAYVGVFCESPDKCRNRLYEGDIEVLKDGKLLKTFKTNALGRYLVYLEPGVYTFQKEGLSPTPRLNPVNIQVSKGYFSEVNLNLILVTW